MEIINYYMIHCDEHTERLENIYNLEKKLNKPIRMFKGYFTKYNSINTNDKINYLQQFDTNLKFVRETFCKPGEIGCYLSHHMLIKEIAENTEKLHINDYSVIFEDDVTFNINLHEEIVKMIKTLTDENIDWDLIFLGNLTKNHKDQIKNNIYTIDETNVCTGTHALLFNNANITKIYQNNCDILHAIDFQYKILVDKKKLNGLVIFPPLCFQQKNLYKSNIQ
jgi:GR25 family glycosyltransferase involved in LPS biosynthesis